MFIPIRLVLIALLVSFTCPLTFAAEPAAPSENETTAKPAAKEPVVDMAKLEAKFEKTMTGATMVGFATHGDTDAGAPKEDRYSIVKVTKSKGDYWVFTAKMQIGGKDVVLPLLIPVKWAGDTPVISMTDMGIPGMGTFTARVLIYDDHYAGTWSGHNQGGQLWGKIEHAKADGQAADPKDEKKEEKGK